MRKILKIIGINLLIFMAILVPLDYFLGVVIDRGSETIIARSVVLREWPLNRDMVQIPPDYTRQLWPKLSPDGYRMRIDVNGFILGPGDAPETADIIFIGGSTTESMYVDEDKRFPYLVGEQLVQTDDGSSVGVINGGHTGSNTLHSLITLLAKGIPLRPKRVVLMHNINDLTLLTKTGSYWDTPATRVIVQSDEKVKLWAIPISDRLQYFLEAGASMLYPNLFYGAKIYLPSFAQKKADSDEWGKYRRSRPAATDAVAEAQFRAALESFIAIAQAWGIEVVLMTQFNRIRYDDDAIRQNYLRLGRTRSYDEYVPLYARFNEIVRELATQYKLVLIDLDRLVPPEERYVYDPVHLNNAGSVLVADIISVELAKNFADLSLRN